MLFQLVPERCRVGHRAGVGECLEIVYKLAERAPVGARQKLVLSLQHALSGQGLQLEALDLFDEFMRLTLPPEAPANLVEAALRESLQKLERGKPPVPDAGASGHLRRYLSESAA